MSRKSKSLIPKCSIDSYEFVARLVQQLYREEENLVVSPLVVLSGLAMLLLGADGNTRAELLKTMFETASRDSEVAAECVRQFSHALSLNMEINNETLSITNLVYFKQGVSFSEEYVSNLIEHFKVQAKNLNFASTATAEEEIVSDIRKATKGKIPGINVPINPLDCLILVAAIYFKDKWEHPFEMSNTKQDGDFHLDNGRIVKTPLMNDERKRLFYLDPATNTKAVRLTYCTKPGPFRKNVSMVLILPGESVKMAEFVRAFTGDQLDHILCHLSEVTVKLKMPRFKLYGEHSLESVLNTLGLKDSLDREKANFRNISQVPLCISQVKHSAMIEVDEKGTEAAAYTCFNMGLGSCGPPISEIVEFYADRPFMYSLVADLKWNKSILFIGVVATFPE